jgi:hypothetical protein
LRVRVLGLGVVGGPVDLGEVSPSLASHLRRRRPRRPPACLGGRVVSEGQIDDVLQRPVGLGGQELRRELELRPRLLCATLGAGGRAPRRRGALGRSRRSSSASQRRAPGRHRRQQEKAGCGRRNPPDRLPALGILARDHYSSISNYPAVARRAARAGARVIRLACLGFGVAPGNPRAGSYGGPGGCSAPAKDTTGYERLRAGSARREPRAARRRTLTR